MGRHRQCLGLACPALANTGGAVARSAPTKSAFRALKLPPKSQVAPTQCQLVTCPVPTNTDGAFAHNTHHTISKLKVTHFIPILSQFVDGWSCFPNLPSQHECTEFERTGHPIEYALLSIAYVLSASVILSGHRFQSSTWNPLSRHYCDRLWIAFVSFPCQIFW